MGSQVRILYRPPSKAQVRGVKPLAFFFLAPRLAPKVTPKTNRTFLKRHRLPAVLLLTSCSFLNREFGIFPVEPCVWQQELWRQGPNGQLHYLCVSSFAAAFNTTHPSFGQRLVSFRYLPA
jgi:hypothetical protein